MVALKEFSNRSVLTSCTHTSNHLLPQWKSILVLKVFFSHMNLLLSFLVEVEKQKSTNLAVGRKSIPNLLICGHSEAWRSILMISMTIKTTGKFISNGNGWIKTYRYILHVCKEPATCLSTTGTTPEDKKKFINFTIFILRVWETSSLTIPNMVRIIPL